MSPLCPCSLTKREERQVELPLLSPPRTAVVSASPRFLLCPESWGWRKKLQVLPRSTEWVWGPSWAVSSNRATDYATPGSDPECPISQAPPRTQFPQSHLPPAPPGGAAPVKRRWTSGLGTETDLGHSLSAASICRDHTELPTKAQIFSRVCTHGGSETSALHEGCSPH